MTKNDIKLDTVWRASRNAKPRSSRRIVLQRDMVHIQLKRMKDEIRALRKGLTAEAKQA